MRDKIKATKERLIKGQKRDDNELYKKYGEKYKKKYKTEGLTRSERMILINRLAKKLYVKSGKIGCYSDYVSIASKQLFK